MPCPARVLWNYQFVILWSTQVLVCVLKFSPIIKWNMVFFLLDAYAPFILKYVLNILERKN
jgi:hypothetical protein